MGHLVEYAITVLIRVQVQEKEISILEEVKFHSQITPQRTPQLQHHPRPMKQDVSQMSQISATPAQPQPQLRVEVSPPSETHSTQYQYDIPSPHGAPKKEVYDQRYEIGQLPVAQFPVTPNYPEIIGGAEFPDEPRKLFVYDEDRGRLDFLKFNFISVTLFLIMHQFHL